MEEEPIEEAPIDEAALEGEAKIEEPMDEATVLETAATQAAEAAAVVADAAASVAEAAEAVQEVAAQAVGPLPGPVSKVAQLIKNDIMEATAMAVADMDNLELGQKLAAVRQKIEGKTAEKTAAADNPFLQRLLDALIIIEIWKRHLANCLPKQPRKSSPFSRRTMSFVRKQLIMSACTSQRTLRLCRLRLA